MKRICAWFVLLTASSGFCPVIQNVRRDDVG